MHLLEGPDIGHSTGEGKLEVERWNWKKKKKSPAAGRIWALNIQIMRCVLYHCATTAAREAFYISLLQIHKFLLISAHPPLSEFYFWGDFSQRDMKEKGWLPDDYISRLLGTWSLTSATANLMAQMAKVCPIWSHWMVGLRFWQIIDDFSRIIWFLNDPDLMVLVSDCLQLIKSIKQPFRPFLWMKALKISGQCW